MSTKYKIIGRVLFSVALAALLLVGSGALCFLYVVHWSKEARIGNRNDENAHQLTIGMTKQQAIAIMGSPDRIVAKEGIRRDQVRYMYLASPLASDYISFYLGNQSKQVEAINLGD